MKKRYLYYFGEGGILLGGDKTAMDARLIPDVCADSLDAVDLAMAIEEKTGVNVPDDVMPTFRTVGDLLSYLNEHGA